MWICFVIISSIEILFHMQGKFTKFRMLTKYRIQASLHNDEPLCGLWPHYRLVGRSAAFGPIINLWATSRPSALLYNVGPLYDPFPIFNKHPKFGEFTPFLVSIYLLSNKFRFAIGSLRNNSIFSFRIFMVYKGLRTESHN